MKLVIAGGTGQVGSLVCRALARDGHDSIVLSRRAGPADSANLAWDGRTLGPWVDALEGADVLLNLAGYTVNCRYHRSNRERILRSRIDSTRVLGEAVGACSRPPPIWLQASTATLYADRYDAPNDQANGVIGGAEPHVPDTWRFSIDVATAWEQALDDARTPHTRKVKLRSAMIMSPDPDGVFDVLLGLVRRGLGGRAGHGRQYVSWIHHEDFVRALHWLIEHGEVEGAVNLSAPEPLPYADFMAALRGAWGIGFGLPATRWMLELGALALRTETELVLKSRRVVPGLLLRHGFHFRHATWPDAARSLCEEWRVLREE